MSVFHHGQRLEKLGRGKWFDFSLLLYSERVPLSGNHLEDVMATLGIPDIWSTAHSPPSPPTEAVLTQP